MTRATRSSGVDLDDLLTSLPSSFVTCPLPGATLVAGPSGVYLVVERAAESPEPPDPAALASAVRVVLADHLTLAPFVHPLVLVDDDASSATVTVVPRSLLLEALTDGPRLVDDVTIRRLGELIVGGVLDLGRDPDAAVRGWAGAPSLH
ncbi:MAG: hypothetical protein JWM05_3238 [Acidimicrobiales bacterium]|nr:hypothetical protein [Acidimicrobiales bacterium]